MFVNMYVQPVVIYKDFFYQYETLSVLKRQKSIKIKLSSVNYRSWRIFKTLVQNAFYGLLNYNIIIV